MQLSSFLYLHLSPAGLKAGKIYVPEMCSGVRLNGEGKGSEMMSSFSKSQQFIVYNHNKFVFKNV